MTAKTEPPAGANGGGLEMHRAWRLDAQDYAQDPRPIQLLTLARLGLTGPSAATVAALAWGGAA